MAPEKRKYPRFAKPLEARWGDSSTKSRCRVLDISWGGCFVETMVAPPPGQHSVIDVEIGEREVRLTGAVLYREGTIGFAMEFEPLTDEQKDVLKELLGAPPIS